MNKKLIVAVIVFSLLLGYLYGNEVDPNQYPFIIQPEPPFSVGDSATSYGQNVTSDLFPTIMAKPESQSYVYLRTSASCDDINVYALSDGQMPEESTPIKVIDASLDSCQQDGSFINTELVVDSDLQIALSSNSEFTYGAYFAVEGDDISFVYNQTGGNNDE